MSDILAGKVVIVTGASGRIGRAIAIEASRHGASVVIVADANEEAPDGGPTTVYAIESLGGAAQFVRTDVCDHRQVEALVATAVRFGGVDLMVANAGDSPSLRVPNLAEWGDGRILSLTLDATLSCAQAAAQQMSARGKGGSIVLVAAPGAVRGAVRFVHSTMRDSIVLMGRHLAAVVGPEGIRVNTVCRGSHDLAGLRDYPSNVETLDRSRARMVPPHPGIATEIADAVVWLGSDMSSDMSGGALLVDGGRLSFEGPTPTYH